MTVHRYIKLYFAFTMPVFACRQNDPVNKQVVTAKENIVSSSVKTKLADYKTATYQISLGENYKNSSSVIQWQWANLADPDDKLDSAGKDAFLYLGEPLLKFNHGEWLPSLFIRTDKNIITSFACSVLFSLGENKNALNDFLKLLSNDIEQLKDPEIIKAINTNGYYEARTADITERIEFKKSKGTEDDMFKYSITAN